jgi:hypothetical protein
VTSPFLVDKSALARWHRPLVAEVLDPLHERGLLAICPAVEYELMYSPRGKSELSALASWLRGFDYLYCEHEVSERALGQPVPDHDMSSTAQRAMEPTPRAKRASPVTSGAPSVSARATYAAS